MVQLAAAATARSARLQLPPELRAAWRWWRWRTRPVSVKSAAQVATSRRRASWVDQRGEGAAAGRSSSSSSAVGKHLSRRRRCAAWARRKHGGWGAEALSFGGRSDATRRHSRRPARQRHGAARVRWRRVLHPAHVSCVWHLASSKICQMEQFAAAADRRAVYQACRARRRRVPFHTCDAAGQSPGPIHVAIHRVVVPPTDDTPRCPCTAFSALMQRRRGCWR